MRVCEPLRCVLTLFFFSPPSLPPSLRTADTSYTLDDPGKMRFTKELAICGCHFSESDRECIGTGFRHGLFRRAKCASA